MKRVACLAICLALGLEPTAQVSTPVEPLAVSFETIDGMRWWTVQARNVPVELFLSEVARRSGRRVEGLEATSRSALVTASLERRPIDHVLEYVLGSIGLDFQLRRDAITVLQPGAKATREEALARASAAWLRVTSRFPDYHAAPSARLAQGEIAELAGHLVAANEHYQTLIENYPASKSVDEAYMRSARLLERMESWNEASMQYRTLANRPSEYRASAHLGLARCAIELGNPESARHLVDALEVDFPTTDPVEETERLLVRAQALNALDRHMEALRALDKAAPELDPLASREAWRIRAQSLEGVGLPAESARAWLLFSREAEDAERGVALREAVRLSLEAGDELGAIFVCKEAERVGLKDAVADPWREARKRLGLDPAPASDSLEPLEIGERLALAEGWSLEGRPNRACEAFDALFRQRDALDENQAARVTVGWAHCVERDEGLEKAVAILAEARGRLLTLEARSLLDVGAARTFERHGMFEEAVQAYAGRY